MFFGYPSKPEWIDKIPNLKVTKKKVNVCSRDKGRCWGSLPFEENGETIWRYVYRDEDGNSIYDDGITNYIYTTTIGGKTISWADDC